MRFLLDTNICSAYLKGDSRVFNRFIQHTGGLTTSAIVVGELYSWVHRAKTAPSRLNALNAMFSEIQVLPVDYAVAITFGTIRAQLLDIGRPSPEIDLLIASTALTHDLTLVTHNVRDFSAITGLRIADWLEN